MVRKLAAHRRRGTGIAIAALALVASAVALAPVHAQNLWRCGPDGR